MPILLATCSRSTLAFTLKGAYSFQLLRPGSTGFALHVLGELCSFELHQFSQTPRSMFEDWSDGVFEDGLWWMGEREGLPLTLTCDRTTSDWQIVLLGFAEESLRNFWQLVEAQISEASYHKYVLPGGWIGS